MNPHPHELAPLLLDLGHAGIELAPHPTDADRLRHRPANLPASLRDRLGVHKRAVLDLLRGGPVDRQFRTRAHEVGGTVCALSRPEIDHPYPEAWYVLDERLGVADGLGMPTHPGSPAWLVAVGEAVHISAAGRTVPTPDRPQAWADLLADGLGVPVLVAGVLPKGERFAGEPDWKPEVPSRAANRR